MNDYLLAAIIIYPFVAIGMLAIASALFRNGKGGK